MNPEIVPAGFLPSLAPISNLSFDQHDIDHSGGITGGGVTSSPPQKVVCLIPTHMSDEERKKTDDIKHKQYLVSNGIKVLNYLPPLESSSTIRHHINCSLDNTLYLYPQSLDNFDFRCVC